MSVKACLDLTALATADRFRGIGRYASGLAAGLAALPGEPGAPELSALITDGRRPMVVPLERGLDWAAQAPAPAWPFSSFAMYNAWKRAMAPGALSAGGVDLFHAPDPKGTPVSGSRRTVVTCHDLIPYILGAPYLPAMWPRPVQRFVERARYRRPDHVIAISHHTSLDLERATGLGRNRVTVIHHGVDSGLFNPGSGDGDQALAREAAGDGPFFLYVGAFDPRRQVDLLLEGYAAAAPTVPERLVLCGSPYRAQRGPLQDRLSRLGIADRVTLVERAPEPTLVALYRHATAHVMLSMLEGFGMTLLEAMACGCPVVAMDASAVPELCGDAALLLARGCGPDKVGRTLERLSSDAGQQEDLRRRGLRRAEAFTWERCARETLGVYQAVCGTERAG